MDELEKRSRCRVCGWLFLSPAWDEDGEPSYGICPSCGCEVGNTDWTLERTRHHREQWIAGGVKWWSTVWQSPSNWDPIEQMKSIPPEWR